MPTAVEYAAFAPPMPRRNDIANQAPQNIANQNPQNIVPASMDDAGVGHDLDKASPKLYGPTGALMGDHADASTKGTVDYRI